MFKKIIFIFIPFLIQNLSFAACPQCYYSTINGKQTAALKTELHNILIADTSRYYSYGSGAKHTWNGFYIADRDSNIKIISIFAVSNMFTDTYQKGLYKQVAS